MAKYPKWSGEGGNLRPPYFTGEEGPRGGPMWLAPTYEYHGPQEIAPEIHALTEHPEARYISQIHPTIQISAGGKEEEQGELGHYVTVQHQHPAWLQDVRQRYPNANPGEFEVRYWHGGDQPALEGTRREDLREIFPEEGWGPEGPPKNPISHQKHLYSGDDPREAQRAAVQAVSQIHRFTQGFRHGRNEGE